MKTVSRLRAVTRLTRFTIVLGALGFATWSYWQKKNQADAALWAASTDQVD
jgi:hypothetical protein